MDSDDVKWGYVKLMKLINLLRKHPTLWDRRLPEYSNNDQRKLALRSIAVALNTTTDNIRRKLHTMRSQYTKESRIMKTNHNYKPKWKLFNDFKFVFQHDKEQYDSMQKSRQITKNCEDDDSQISLNENCLDSEDEKCISEARKSEIEDEKTFEESEQHYEFKFEEIAANDTAIVPNIQITKNAGINSKSMEFAESSSYPIEIHSNIGKRKSETQCFRDEFSVFGENIANEMRALSDHKSIQLDLKCKILRALLEANEALHRLGWT